MLAVLACDHDKDAAQGQTPRSRCRDSSRVDTTGPALTLAPDSGPPPAFDGDRAMQYVKEIVKFGPRPLGSANHKKVEEYIASRLKGDHGRGRHLHRRHAGRKVSGAQHHRQISRNERRHHRHRQPLRYELSAAQHILRRCQRRRFVQRSAARTCQPVARQAARRLQRLAGLGRCRRGDETGRLRRSSAGNAFRRRQPLWHHSSGREVAGRRNARRRSKHFCWPT